MTTKTTARLVMPPTTRLPAPDEYRRALSAVILAIVALAIVVSLAWREMPPTPQAERAIEPKIVFIVATPTPQPPTIAPTMPPTAEPQIVYATVEVPIYVQVQSAPVVHEEWRPPLVSPDDACAAWHPPLAYPEGCP